MDNSIVRFKELLLEVVDHGFGEVILKVVIMNKEVKVVTISKQETIKIDSET